MKYDDWLDIAGKALQKTQIGQKFSLRDLFEGHEWKSFEVGDRLGFGRFFKAKVLAGEIEGVSYIGKAENNSALYIRYKQ